MAITEPRPGNATWSVNLVDANLNRPVMEGVDFAASVASSDLLIAFWGTEVASGGWDSLDRTITWARLRGVGIYIHVDSPAHRAQAMEARQRVLNAGLVPVLGAHAVLSAVDFEADARAFAALGPWGITLNYRAHGKDSDAFKEVILKANQLTRELKPVVVWFASWANAGPSMKAYCAEVCRLTPMPVTRPHQASQSLPPVTPPVTPLPPPNADTPVPSTSRPVQASRGAQPSRRRLSNQWH